MTRAWNTAVVGFALFGASGCINQPDEFNDKAAELMCEYNAADPEQPFLDRTRPLEGLDANDPDSFVPYGQGGGGSCQSEVRDNLDACAAACTLVPRKARRCVRKLRRGVRSGQYNESDVSVCDRVYECGEQDPGVSVTDQCRITTSPGCSSGGGAPSGLALLLLGLFVRRRRG
ncbi:MAG: MYXO-CTERM sorting domain-containing protein [Myxococcota bacterium]